MGLNGQTLLRVQRNGLKMANKLKELEPSFGHNVKPPKAKPRVQTFGYELPWALDLDGHSLKPLKAKPKAQRKKEHPTSVPAQNNLSNLTAKILSVFCFFFYEKKKLMASQP
jgi:hypothetical protein